MRELREPGQPDPLAELIELFLRDARPRLDTMQATAAAGEWPRLAAAAHTLKGSASNLGARRLATLCAALEKQAHAKMTTEAIATLADVRKEFVNVELILTDELSR